jgi:WD40 repeat protein
MKSDYPLIRNSDIKSVAKTRLITNLKYACTGCQYSGDGRALAFKEEHTDSYFIYNHNTNPSSAYEIDKGQDATFHPHNNLLALLLDDDSIEFYNYETLTLIAKTSSLLVLQNLLPIKMQNYNNAKKLAFSPNGTEFIVTSLTKCYRINTLQNNLFEICYVLSNSLPKDLVKIILQQIVPHSSLVYINLAELSKVRLLEKPVAAKAGQTEEATQQKTKKIYITCVRKE